MSGKRSRRQVSVEDASRWVFNRMAQDYDARPAYPTALVDAIIDFAGTVGKRVCDVGAGIGHLALPLAQRGLEVTAVEPALLMLERLRASALENGLHVRSLHAAAESLPIESSTLDLVLVADALHFIDTERAAREISRVLVPRGALALLTCEFTPTPFMREIVRLMQESAPRRPRKIVARRAQLSGVSSIPLTQEQRFFDETPVTAAELERILATISFIGPAMNPERTATFRQRLHALHLPAVWARTFTLRTGSRSRVVTSNLRHLDTHAMDPDFEE
jgi:ubiquinone/menaquinone biosynthesis C-methylase UbiE